MALVAVVDAQIKCKGPVTAEEEMKKAPWWKRTKR
jgi:hypothetical protein